MKEKAYDAVSVIILHYNQADYLFTAIDSVLVQNYQKIELIISDDHSVAFSAAIIEEYIEQNKRNNIVRSTIIINRENLGTVKNINAALDQVTGKYIKIFAADDALYDPYVIEAQIKDICDHQLLVTTGLLNQCDERLNTKYDASVNKNNSSLSMILKMPNTRKEKYIYKHNLFPYITQSMMFTNEFFNQYGKYSEDYLLIEDTPMMWKIIDNNIELGLIDRFVIKHRGDVGVTGKNTKNPKLQFYYDDCIKLLKERKEREIGWMNEMDCSIQIHLFEYRKANLDSKQSKTKCKLIAATIPAAIIYVLLHPVRFLRVLLKK